MGTEGELGARASLFREHLICGQDLGSQGSAKWV